MEGDSDPRVFSRSDGTFRFQLPPWFDGCVLATKPGYGSVHRRARESLDLVLQQEGKVRLEVRMPPRDGEPRHWSFAARDPATGFMWRRIEWRMEVEGSYLLSGLPPGRLILLVDTESEDAETEVVVVALTTVPAVVDAPE